MDIIFEKASNELIKGFHQKDLCYNDSLTNKSHHHYDRGFRCGTATTPPMKKILHRKSKKKVSKWERGIKKPRRKILDA